MVEENETMKSGTGKINIIEKLINDAKNTPDEECFGSSKDYEISYIKQANIRIIEVINFIQEAVDSWKKEKETDITKIKLLDVGCSPFTFSYKNVFDVNIKSIDLTDLLANRCKNKSIEFKTCDIRVDPFPFESNSFDILVFTEIFEHLHGPTKPIFSEITRVLKEGGYIVFSSINVARLVNRLKLLVGKPIQDPVTDVYRENIADKGIHGYGHIREYTMKELICLLMKYDFEILKYKHMVQGYKSKDRMKNLYEYFCYCTGFVFPKNSLLDDNLILAKYEKHEV